MIHIDMICNYAIKMQYMTSSTWSHRSLEMAWKAMKADTLDIARIHENAGADFEKMAQEIATFTEEQKRQAKVVSG